MPWRPTQRTEPTRRSSAISKSGSNGGSGQGYLEVDYFDCGWGTPEYGSLWGWSTEEESLHTPLLPFQFGSPFDVYEEADSEAAGTSLTGILPSSGHEEIITRAIVFSGLPDCGAACPSEDVTAQLQAQLEVVPEPSAIWLLAPAALLAVLARRRFH